MIALYRTDRGRFAVDETGEWQPSIKTTICTAKEDGLSVAYLCGLLNSELLDLWYSVRGKTPRDVWRNYEPKPMARMPYRHVAEISGGGERLARLEGLLAVGDAGEAFALVGKIGAELRAETDVEGEAAAALERLVRAVAGNRRELLSHRAVVPDLGTAIKDPWRVGPLAVDERSFLEALPASTTRSIELEVEVTTDGTLGRPTREGDALVFSRSRTTTARVSGPAKRLALVERALAGDAQLLGADLQGLLLPRDADAFASVVAERAATVERLLQAGRVLVEAAERLVCALYAVPSDLEDAVVEHASQRAARRSAPTAD